MQENIKIIAVLTEEGDLNIHAIDINHIELTIEEKKQMMNAKLWNICYRGLTVYVRFNGRKLKGYTSNSNLTEK